MNILCSWIHYDNVCVGFGSTPSESDDALNHDARATELVASGRVFYLMA